MDGSETTKEAFQKIETGRILHTKKLKMKSYKKGGIVHKTGPAMLHKGEYVVPRDKVEQQHKDWMMSDGGAMKK